MISTQPAKIQEIKSSFYWRAENRIEGETSTSFLQDAKAEARNYLVVNNQCETSRLSPLPYTMQVNWRDRQRDRSIDIKDCFHSVCINVNHIYVICLFHEQGNEVSYFSLQNLEIFLISNLKLICLFKKCFETFLSLSICTIQSPDNLQKHQEFNCIFRI